MKSARWTDENGWIVENDEPSDQPATWAGVVWAAVIGAAVAAIFLL